MINETNLTEFNPEPPVLTRSLIDLEDLKNKIKNIPKKYGPVILKPKYLK